MHNTIQITSDILLKLGIAPRTKGYHYICKAVDIYLERPTVTLNFSKNLYPEVADYFDVASSSVERAIRNAIHTGYVHGDIEFAYSIFQNTLHSKADIPTNTLFISAVSEWIKNHTI